MKYYLEELIKSLKENLDNQNRVSGNYKETKIVLTSEEQPTPYGKAWVMKIDLDGRLIYKDVHIIQNVYYPTSLLEDDMADKAIRMIFGYGVFSTKKSLEILDTL